MGVAAMALAGCASVQPYQSMQARAVSNHYVVAAYPGAPDYMHGFLDGERSVWYTQNQGGGGVAVGLLFGPLGVAANIAAIKKHTEADLAAFQGKVPIDASRLFAEAATGVPRLTAAGGDGASAVSPLLLVEKLDDEHVRFAALLYVTGTEAGKSWVRQYIYEVPEVYSSAQLTRGLDAMQLQQLAADTRLGFGWTATTFADDLAGAFHPDHKAVLRSEFVTPRIEIAMSGYAFEAGNGRVGFATGQPRSSAVYSLASDNATLANR